MSAGFNYQSAKDVLRWEKLSRKQHIKYIMVVGSIVHLGDKQFQEYLDERSFVEIDAEALAELYK